MLSSLTCKDLIGALKNKEIVSYYQPIVCASKYKIIGAEALARWDRPQQGLIYPNIIFPLAEKCGVIVDLEKQLISQVIKDTHSYHKAGYLIQIAINLSHQLLSTEGFLPWFLGIIKSHHIHPFLIKIEIGETVELTPVVLEKLRVLGNRGFYLSIDDYGIEHSSLSRIGEIAVKEIKLDKSLIQDDRPASTTTLSRVIRVAQKLHYGLIAEGVESVNQIKRIKQIAQKQNYSITGLQGYYFSPPVSGFHFKTLLANLWTVEKSNPTPFPISRKALTSKVMDLT